MTTIIQQITWGLSGITTGAGALIGMRGTDSILAGKTNFGAYKQTLCVWRAVHESFEALNAINRLHPNSIKEKIILLAITPLPFALQILLNYTPPTSFVHQNCNFIRKNLSKVVLAVDLCASAIIASTAPPIFGICIAASITIEILKENQLLSIKVKKVWEKVAIGITFMQALGSPLLAMMTLSECAWVVANSLCMFMNITSPIIPLRCCIAQQSKKQKN